MNQGRYRIGKTFIAMTTPQDSAERIKQVIREGKKGYVCISNMRTVTIANSDGKYRKVMDESLFNAPDGTPLVWCARAWGLKDVERTCGPHLFRAMLKDNDFGLRHFFLGDTDETLAALTEKCRNEYGAEVAGSYSPPFAPLEEYDLRGIAEMINDSGANMVWTSLRAPKQDYLDNMLLPYLNDGVVLVGVGAAFRSELGLLRQPEGLLQKVGLAGIIFKRPESNWGKEIKWYFKHSFILLKYLTSILWNRIRGKKHYEL